MSRPLRLEFPGAVWHLYNRGVNRQDIFLDEVDRKLFLTILARTVRRYGWLVHAWVQMTNHYHLLVETPQTNLSAGMHDLDGDYAKAVNQHHGRIGHLFQSRFRDALVEKESHLLELIRYVVLNPVRARMVESPGDWAWSSYPATAGMASPPDWLNVRWTLDQFDPWDRLEAHRLYREFVAAGAGITRSPWEDLRCGLYLGSIEFGEKLSALVGSRAVQPEYSRARRHPDRPTPLGTAQSRSDGLSGHSRTIAAQSTRAGSRITGLSGARPGRDATSGSHRNPRSELLDGIQTCRGRPTHRADSMGKDLRF